MRIFWERERHPLVNARVRRFIYVVDVAGEERIVWRRSGVRLAVMEKRRLSGNILGEPKTFKDKEYAKILSVF